VNLRFNANGELRYRVADAAGYTPIGSYAEFQLLNTYGYAPANKYRQEADLNLLGSLNGGTTWTGQKWNPIRDNTPETIARFVPNFSFSGEYDGAGYAIRGLWVDSAVGDYKGLFGSVTHCTLTNIRIESGLVQGYGIDYTAGVVAKGDAGVHITNCSNNARVAGGGNNTGGVVGYLQGYYTVNKSDMVDCSNSGAISGGSYIGGVAGRLIHAALQRSSNNGAVNGKDHVGGVVGFIVDSSSIVSSYNNNEVNGNSCVGGVLGYSYGVSVVSRSYNKGAVNASNGAAGGVIGTAHYDDETYMVTDIEASYNSGAVNGYYAGGVSGGGDVTITASYNSGAVNGTYAGGVIGYGSGSLTDNYWLYNPDADASNGRGYGSNVGCTRFGGGSWPTDNPTADWGVGSAPATGKLWKTLGAWAGGGTPDGVNSTFPKLYWEED
jgi:hypothetical protein